MVSIAAGLSVELGNRVEAVCRHYLSNGFRSGAYWVVGSVLNENGRSLFVRLTGPPSGKGARGKWQDAATGEHGDLLDLITAREGHRSLGETFREVRRFLGLPERANPDGYALKRPPDRSIRTDTTGSARRIWQACQPVRDTLAERYLLMRGIGITGISSLRFHPALPYRDRGNGQQRSLPALVASVTDLKGCQTGIQRRWLSVEGVTAPVDEPRRSLGILHGHGVWLRHGRRFQESGILVLGEGLETVLSLAEALPTLTLIASLSASHLAAFQLPAWTRRLILLQDNDPAGVRATRRLAEKGISLGLPVQILRPVLKDFNTDLVLLGRRVLVETLQRQVPELLAA